ncbi:hypothetical protein [Streptomyces sp. NPDC059371]
MPLGVEDVALGVGVSLGVDEGGGLSPGEGGGVVPTADDLLAVGV